jgi:pyruvate dehydrogenase E2 component (dihydrolipoamide acetyltransferase)
MIAGPWRSRRAASRAQHARWDEAAQEVVTYRAVNLGIAVATPRGLMVPNIRDVNSLTLRELARCPVRPGLQARDGKTARDGRLTNGINQHYQHPGFGIDSTPIGVDRVGPCAAGAIRRRPWEFQGQIALRCDDAQPLVQSHRLVDGAEGSAFLAEIGRILADPLGLIALRMGAVCISPTRSPS